MKLHLGCWHRDFPGFINVDLCDLPHIHYKSYIHELPFIEDASVDYVYCSHALEYYDLESAKLALKEWLRVLKPGGMLRLAVPNFEALLEVYQKTRDIKRILGPMFGRMQVSGVGEDKFIYHKIVYDFKLLSEVLTESGFVDIKLYDWRTTEHSNFDDHSQAYFPHMDKEHGLLISLNVECKK